MASDEAWKEFGRLAAEALIELAEQEAQQQAKDEQEKAA